ncbi:MAG: DUF1997 domain-containing protein [Candidatus Sericytochromatia bacterium]|nr:DUF1997 domain-containing protein [Candidatus Sericytochromatia bacterium]
MAHSKGATTVQMTFTGRATRQGLLPVGLGEALAYFEDVKAFIQKIEDVREVRELSLPRSYLMTHHPMGGLNHYITVATALQAESTPSGLLLKGLDFDPLKVRSEHQVVKGFIDGRLDAHPQGPEETAIDFAFGIALEFEVPAALSLVPRPLIQATADGLMRLKLSLIVDNLYSKVRQDFNLKA